MDDGRSCDHEWFIERSVRTGVEQNRQGRHDTS
jgi:hypothetical protein